MPVMNLLPDLVQTGLSKANLFVRCTVEQTNLFEAR